MQWHWYWKRCSDARNPKNVPAADNIMIPIPVAAVWCGKQWCDTDAGSSTEILWHYDLYSQFGRLCYFLIDWFCLLPYHAYAIAVAICVCVCSSMACATGHSVQASNLALSCTQVTSVCTWRLSQNCVSFMTAICVFFTFMAINHFGCQYQILVYFYRKFSFFSSLCFILIFCMISLLCPILVGYTLCWVFMACHFFCFTNL